MRKAPVGSVNGKHTLYVCVKDVENVGTLKKQEREREREREREIGGERDSERETARERRRERERERESYKADTLGL